LRVAKDEAHASDPMTEAELLQRVSHVLAKASAPLLAREIAAELKRQGVEVDRSDVNKVLYRHNESLFLQDDDYRWQATRKLNVSGLI
jgi:hypothetical protein